MLMLAGTNVLIASMLIYVYNHSSREILLIGFILEIPKVQWGSCGMIQVFELFCAAFLYPSIAIQVTMRPKVPGLTEILF